jgi:hypothetical protein
MEYRLYEKNLRWDGKLRPTKFMVIDRLLEWCVEDLERFAFLHFFFFSEVTTCDQRIMAERNSVVTLQHRIFRTATCDKPSEMWMKRLGRGRD